MNIIINTKGERMNPSDFEVIKNRVEKAIAEGVLSKEHLRVCEGMKTLAVPVVKFFDDTMTKDILLVPFLTSILFSLSSNTDDAMHKVKEMESIIIRLDKQANEVDNNGSNM